MDVADTAVLGMGGLPGVGGGGAGEGREVEARQREADPLGDLGERMGRDS
jgi:hypothetical protein